MAMNKPPEFMSLENLQKIEKIKEIGKKHGCNAVITPNFKMLKIGMFTLVELQNVIRNNKKKAYRDVNVVIYKAKGFRKDQIPIVNENKPFYVGLYDRLKDTYISELDLDWLEEVMPSLVTNAKTYMLDYEKQLIKEEMTCLAQ